MLLWVLLEKQNKCYLYYLCATPQLINFLKPGSILPLIGYTSQKEGLGCVPEDNLTFTVKEILNKIYVQYVCTDRKV